MSETTNRPTTRRAMMGNAGIAALTGIAAVTIAKPDAAAVEVLPTRHHAETPLLAACARFMAIQAAVDVINDDLEDDHQHELMPLIKQQARLLDEMAELRAVGIVEQRARAQVLMAWYGVKSCEEGHSAMEWDRLQPLFRDLLGEAS